MNPDKAKLLRTLPPIDQLLQEQHCQNMIKTFSYKITLEALRETMQWCRKQIINEQITNTQPKKLLPIIFTQTKKIAHQVAEPYFRRVINATGIILHTGLGRAVLAPAAVDQINKHLRGYSILQLDPKTGKRSKRNSRLEWLLQKLTNAEAATVVNNNAAATMIVLNTIAGDGKEVIVSRGQLVEIGGSFRLPEVFQASGATMVEVGTTNKTHLHDYADAITENTAAILRVHPSNYQITGFSSEVSLPELEKLAHANNLALIDDVGAGALIDYSQFGFKKEPTLADAVETGADIITSSGDKLIAGAQGGIIIGKKKYIDKIRKNPLARVLRIDKITMAALEATLILFLKGEEAYQEMPVLKMLLRTYTDITKQAERICKKLQQALPDQNITLIDGFSKMGSGSLPEQNLPTKLIAIANIQPEPISYKLRNLPVPIFSRIQNEKILLDPRTILEGEEKELIATLPQAIINKQ